MHRVVFALAAAALAIGGLGTASRAAAQSRVVLASRDPALETALEAALTPWQVTLVVPDAAEVGAAMPASAERGAELAVRYDAVAVAWISIDSEGAAALWIYDRSSDRVVARALPVTPPFDEPTADAVALSIKTLLRHSAAAPEAERVVDPAPPTEWLLEIGAGARALATSPGDVEPRFTLALELWPRGLGGILGLALIARTGTGIGVAVNGTTGRFGSVDPALGIRARVPIASIVDVRFGLDVGLSVDWLDASVGADGHHRMRADVDPTGCLWAELGLRPLPSLRIAVRVGAFVSVETRSYLVRGVSVLDTQVAAPFGELLFDVPLDGGRVDSP